MRLYRTPKSCVCIPGNFVASGSRLGWITDQPQTSLGSSSRRFARWEVWPYEVGPSRAPCLARRGSGRRALPGPGGMQEGWLEMGRFVGSAAGSPPPQREQHKNARLFSSLSPVSRLFC